MPEHQRIELEKAALDFAIKNENPPYLYQLPVEEGRKIVNQVQAEKDDVRLDAEVEIIEGIPVAEGSTVSVKLYKPIEGPDILPVLIYVHGGGWVFGNDQTHDRLMRELAVLGKHAVYFVNYSLSPEAKYPTALEEIYAVVNWVVENAELQCIDIERMTIGGDSVGGNMATAITLLTKEREGPKLAGQLLYYPVTDASFDTPSYHEFAKGYFLHREGMMWFWDQYTQDEEERAQHYASPLRATSDDLKDLPRALIITAEADVLRDEGEQYAEKLREAGVEVTAHRMDKMIHDFMMLNALSETEAKKKALDITVQWLNNNSI